MLRFTSCLAVLAVLVGVGDGATLVVPNSPYAQAVLDDKPIGYWRLGEATGPTAFDRSPNGLDGTYFGGVSPDQPGAILGDPDTSALFDGTTGYVKVPPDPSFNQIGNDLTIEAWIKGTKGVILSTRYWSRMALPLWW